MFRLFLAVCVVVLMGVSPAVAAVDIGAPAPNFTLLDVDGQEVKLETFRGKVVVLEWFNQDCPFVKKHYANGDMQRLQESAKKSGVVWLTINSTNSEHRSFVAPENRAKLVKDLGIKSAAYLSDVDGSVGESFEAVTTPHMYIIDKEGMLQYKGAIDDDPDSFGDPKEAKNFVQTALSEIAAGKPVSNSSTKSYGCSVKYKE